MIMLRLSFIRAFGEGAERTGRFCAWLICFAGGAEGVDNHDSTFCVFFV